MVIFLNVKQCGICGKIETVLPCHQRNKQHVLLRCIHFNYTGITRFASADDYPVAACLPAVTPWPDCVAISDSPGPMMPWRLHDAAAAITMKSDVM